MTEGTREQAPALDNIPAGLNEDRQNLHLAINGDVVKITPAAAVNLIVLLERAMIARLSHLRHPADFPGYVGPGWKLAEGPVQSPATPAAPQASDSEMVEQIRKILSGGGVPSIAPSPAP